MVYNSCGFKVFGDTSVRNYATIFIWQQADLSVFKQYDYTELLTGPHGHTEIRTYVIQGAV